MNRLATAVRWDMRLQFRHGFYYAAIFIAVISIIILSQFSEPFYTVAMPVFVMGNMTINTYFFVAGLVLLEKDDGILEGLVVTPLRRWEYLWSKLLSLMILTVLENGVIVTAVMGLNFNLLLLLAGIILLSFINTLYGFIMVARYDSINSFLFPSVFWTMLLSLPLLQYFGLVATPLMWLHPVQAPLILLVGAFQPVTTWEVLYGLVYGLVWVVILYQWAKRAFYRFIILKQGVSA